MKKLENLKKAIFIVPQIGYNSVELNTIRKILEDNSILCSIASFSVGTVISKTGETRNATKIICNIKNDEYDCLIFVGGKNISWLAEHKCIIELIKNANKENKIIALLCINAALLLPKADLIKGRKVTVFKMKNRWSEKEVLDKGGILIDEPIVIDKNIITCRDEKDSENFGKILAETIKKRNNKIN